MNIKDAHSYLKMLIKKKKELEKRMEDLNKKKEKKQITEDEYLKEKKKIEREYIEVMDRLVQMKYITGQHDLFS
ncbi:MAG TPA: hypothetical protein ENG40_01950 [Thermoprotei archaeon]|nr:hypothetical protein [Thermoprotei archaeon]